VTVVARVLSILTTITVPRARLEELLIAKVIEFSIPKKLPQTDEAVPGDSARKTS